MKVDTPTISDFTSATHNHSSNSTGGTLGGYQASMTKASGADITTGTDDAKYVTSKAIKDAGLNMTASYVIAMAVAL
jgi:hypothetical protein